MGKREEQKGRVWYSNLKPIMLGAVIAVVFSMIMLLLCSAAVANGLLSDKNMAQYCLVACFAGSFAGGLYGVRRIRGKTLFVGAGTSVIAFLAYLLIGLSSYGEISVFDKGIRVFVACLIGGIAAGLFGGRNGKKSKR